MPVRSQIASFSSKPLLVAGLLTALFPRDARAENSVQYRHESYQELDGRIRVDSEYGQAEAQLPAEIRLRLSGVIDTISGATPTGELDRSNTADPVILSEMHDRRKAWHAEFTRAFDVNTITLGLDNSRESDYVSNAVSLNVARDFNQKNTTLLAGAALAKDDVRAIVGQPWKKKDAADFMLGVTQLLNPETSVTVNLTYGRASGYMNDPYKLVAKTIEILPGLSQYLTFAENRPDERTKEIFNVSANHAVKSLNGALEANYRFYHDSYGINAHTATLQWFQSAFDGRLIINPLVRLHRQSAASFYSPDLDLTSIIPETDPSTYYSSDYRLSKLDTTTLGVKLVWNVIRDRLALDAAYHRYEMQGRDGVTSDRAYMTANIFSIGAKYSW